MTPLAAGPMNRSAHDAKVQELLYLVRQSLQADIVAFHVTETDGRLRRFTAGSEEHLQRVDDYLAEPGAGTDGAPASERAYQGDISSADVFVDDKRVGAVTAAVSGSRRLTHTDSLPYFARQLGILVGHGRLSDSLQQLANRLEVLQALDHLAISTQNYEELSQGLARIICPVLNVTMAGVMVWDEQRDVLQLIPGAFTADRDAVASYQVDAHDATSNAARVFSSGTPYLSNDACSDPGIRHEFAKAFGVKRLLTLPLRSHARAVGVLHLANGAEDFTIKDLERAEWAIPRIATVMELASAVFRLRSEQNLQGVLLNLAVSFASDEPMSAALESALNAAATATDSCLAAFVPIDGSMMVEGRRKQVRALEQQVLVESATQPPLSEYVTAPRMAGDPGSAVLHTPVVLGTRRLGTLTNLRERAAGFAPYERAALSQLADLFAVALATNGYEQQRLALAKLSERQRIADDLHDQVAQLLYAGTMSLDRVLETTRLPAQADAEVHRTRSLLVKADSEIRAVIEDLDRPAPKGLAARLVEVVDNVGQEFGLIASLDVSTSADLAARTLPVNVIDALTRCAREALVNSAKHAGPCEAFVSLSVSGERLLLKVRDNGRGGNGARRSASHGIGALRRSIRGLDGHVRVSHLPSGGTAVTAIVPLSARIAPAAQPTAGDEGGGSSLNASRHPQR